MPAKPGKQFHKINGVCAMATDQPIRQRSLSSQITDILVEKIRSGGFSPDFPLPPENQLAEEYRVSRATIRSAFDKIEAMGLIVRKQGIGTFVRPISSISNPLNQFIDFFKLIADHGYQPSLVQLDARFQIPSQSTARALALAPDEQVLTVEKVFFADHEPIIYSMNDFPVWVFQQHLTSEEILQPGSTEPIDRFLKTCCLQNLSYYVSTVRAQTVQDYRLPEMFAGLAPQTPLLVINNIGFNDMDRPVYQSLELHPGNRMDFKLIRSP